MGERFARLPFKALSRMHELKGNEVLLFNWLCLHRSDDGQCHPSDDLLMEETQLTRSPLFAARKGLIDSGWIECDFEARSYKLAFHPEKQDEPSRKAGQVHPEKQDGKAKTIPKSRMNHPEKQDEPSRKAGWHIGRTDHEQTMNKPALISSAQSEQRDYQRKAESKQQPENQVLGKFPFGDYLAYVQAKNPEKPIARATGLANWMRRNGEDDEAVAAWKAANDAPARAAPKRCGKCNGRGDYLDGRKGRVTCDCPAGREMAAMA